MTIRTKNNTTKEEYIELVKQEMINLLEDGEACDHFHCLDHITEPCPRCGRIAGVRIKEDLNE